VFDSSAGAFVEPRSIQNLDAPVSAAGSDLRFIGGFQLSLASFLQSFAPRQTTNLTGISFNPDGTSMFIIGDVSANDSVFQYSLGSAFDLSSASFTGSSFNVSGQDTSPQGVAFSPDGTSMFVVGDSSNSVFQYSLGSAFDLSSASFTGTSFDVFGQTSRPQGVTFNADGTSMFVVGRSSESVFQYSLGSAFDLSSASFTGSSFNVSGQDTIPQGVTFNGDGTSMFVVGDSSNSVFQYSLSSGFDIATASFTGTSFDVSGQDGIPRGVAFNGDGTSMFVIGSNTDSVFRYLVGEVGPK